MPDTADTERSEQPIAEDAIAASSAAEPKIILALSGGGFRATLFHLGVIRYLRETKRLRRITHIASVSGGSVIAAHLIAEWKSYLGTEEEFTKSAGALVDFTKANVRGRIVSKAILLSSITIFFCFLIPLIIWYFGCLWGHAVIPAIGSLLIVSWILGWFPKVARYLTVKYDTLLGGIKLKDMVGSMAAPKALIASTNLSTGQLMYFSDDGLHAIGNDSKHYKCGQLPLSVAVTASSAFPPAFTPVKISYEYLDVDKEYLPNPQYLTDGGVFDNLGGHLLESLGLPDAEVIVSSAEPLPAPDVESTFDLLLFRSIRSTDILMQRVSELETAKSKTAKQIQLMQDIGNCPMPPNVQKLIRCVRTDLDDFSPVEIQCLYFKGYAAAMESLDEKNDASKFTFTSDGVPLSADAGCWLPIQSTDKGLKLGSTSLKSAGKRRWGKPILLALTVCTGLTGLPFVLYYLSLCLPPSSSKFETARYAGTPSQIALKTKNPWIEAFFSAADDAKKQCPGVPARAIITSDPLQTWFRQLQPNSFDCFVSLEVEGSSIVYCQAFLMQADGTLYKTLEMNADEGLRIRVEAPSRGDRLVVLVETCLPEGKATDEVAQHLGLKLEKSTK